jgi:hypothetical protein
MDKLEIKRALLYKKTQIIMGLRICYPWYIKSSRQQSKMSTSNFGGNGFKWKPWYWNIYIIMWSCPGNMPKYYPDLRDILPDRPGLRDILSDRRVICLSDLGKIWVYYLDKTTLIALLYWVSNCPGNMPKYCSTKYHYRNLHEV